MSCAASFTIRGSRISFIPASPGFLAALRALQVVQAHTRLVYVLPPPRERGTMWSSDSSLVGYFRPQYWQMLRSRR